MAATRLINKARAAASSNVVEEIKAKATKRVAVPKTEPTANAADIAADKLALATTNAMDAMTTAQGKVASLVSAIRACMVAGMDKDAIGATMQRAAIMAKLSVTSDEADKLLEASPRTKEVQAVLHTLKTTKSRAYSVIAREDGPKVTTPKVVAPKAAKAAKLLDPIEVPAPVNAPAFHAQLLKVRVLLAAAVEHAQHVEGTDADLKAAMTALAALPTK